MTDQNNQVSLMSEENSPEAIGNAIVTSRQAQEVQAAMVVAKKFPRDELDCIQRIKQSCKRPRLAEAALYTYPKGGKDVTGPTIRMAEMMAQNWGNLSFGVIELSQENGESQVMSYAWDLETNTRQDKIFTVKHERKKNDWATGKAVEVITRLTDPRDIYEMCANQGARRLRACILGVIPGDVIDEALEECEKTLKGSNDTPLKDRLTKLLSAFEKFAVTKEMIEGKFGHNLAATSEQEFISLRKIHRALKDEMGKREDYFRVSTDLPETSPFEKKAKPAKEKKAPKELTKAESEKAEYEASLKLEQEGEAK